MSDYDNYKEESAKRLHQKEKKQSNQNNRRREGRSKKTSGRRISHSPDDYNWMSNLPNANTNWTNRRTTRPQSQRWRAYYRLHLWKDRRRSRFQTNGKHCLWILDEGKSNRTWTLRHWTYTSNNLNHQRFESCYSKVWWIENLDSHALRPR